MSKLPQRLIPNMSTMVLVQLCRVYYVAGHQNDQENELESSDKLLNMVHLQPELANQDQDEV